MTPTGREHAIPPLTRVAVIVLICAVLFAIPAGAAPTSPLCDDGSWRKAHPLICDTGEPLPNLGPGGGGGGPDGGILGAIGRLLRGIL